MEYQKRTKANYSRCFPKWIPQLPEGHVFYDFSISFILFFRTSLFSSLFSRIGPHYQKRFCLFSLLFPSQHVFFILSFIISTRDCNWIGTTKKFFFFFFLSHFSHYSISSKILFRIIFFVLFFSYYFFRIILFRIIFIIFQNVFFFPHIYH